MTEIFQHTINVSCDYGIETEISGLPFSTNVEERWILYLDYCHTRTDSQNNSTVVHEPFLHTAYTTLKERMRKG